MARPGKSETSHCHVEHGGGDVSSGISWSAVCLDGSALPRSAPVQGVSRPPHTASRDCRNGSPLARAIPCAPAPECGVTRKKEKSRPTMQRRAKAPLHFSSAHPHAAQRAVTGWRGGLGRVGADLASAGSMRHPPSPERHVSAARLATTSVRQETARQNRTAWHATTHASRETATQPQKPAKKRPPQNTYLFKKRNYSPPSSDRRE